MKTLIIVESVKKQHTIQKFLGDDYIVRASVGHISDLDKKDMGISFNDKNDITKGFTLNYKNISGKAKNLKDLKTQMAKCDNVIFATDDDREGEAIAYHLAKFLKKDINSNNRIIFHEITKNAILKAIDNKKQINMDIVNAQQCRRVLDRLIGFELSPLLWKHIDKDLSAGRVQSVVSKLIIEKENSINNFKSVENYKTFGYFSNENNKKNLEAILDKDFDKKDDAIQFLNDSKTSSYSVNKTETKNIVKSPEKPFTTSSFQQEANKRYGYSTKQIMAAAQHLYEQGHITYHRTDSVALSDEILKNIETFVINKFGKDFLNIQKYTNKVKNAQEAHEAIRPTNINNEDLNDETPINTKLYKLIWNRTVASQMAKAKYKENIATIDISNRDEKFIIKFRELIFEGFLKIYKPVENKDNVDYETKNNSFKLNNGDSLNKNKIECKQKISNPPQRFTEGSLVKKLENLGIGRPSTYASIISTIIARKYVEKKNFNGVKNNFELLILNENNLIEFDKFDKIVGKEKNKLIPTELGIKVNDFLQKYFDEIMDYKFTELMEDKLDSISNKSSNWKQVVYDYYNTYHPKLQQINEKQIKIKNDSINNLGINHDGEEVEVYKGKYGKVAKFTKNGKSRFQKIDDSVNLKTIKLHDLNQMDTYPKIIGAFENKNINLNKGKFGFYLTYNNNNYSIPADKDPELLLIDECISIINNKDSSLLKDFGKIKVLNGQFGPYIKKGKQIVGVPKKIELEKLSLDLCQQLLKNKFNKK